MIPVFPIKYPCPKKPNCKWWIIFALGLSFLLTFLSVGQGAELKASYYSLESLKAEGTYRRTKGVMANGKLFDDNLMVCATRLYHIGTLLRITNVDNNRSVVVVVSDKISKRFAQTRIDLSKKAFSDLTGGHLELGLIKVKVERI
jgi:rare lipoprotein A (peptidoglycan hydrolase)